MTGSKTRREFLKTSAAGAAALAGLSLARSAHAAGKEEVKIGMIGCGGRCSGAAAESLQAGPVRQAGRHVRRLPGPRSKASRNYFKENFPSR